MLHVLDPGEQMIATRADCAGHGSILTAAAALREAQDIRHTICLIGGTQCERTARTLGLDTTDRAAPPLMMTELAWPGVDNLIKDRSPIDTVVCWSPAALQVVDRTRARRLPRMLIVPGGLWPSHPVNPRRAAGGIRIIAPGARQGRAWATALASTEAPTRAAQSIARHPTWPSRSSARDWLGLESHDFAAVLVGHCQSDTDALRFVHAVELLASAGRCIIGVIPRGAGRRERAVRAARASAARFVVTDAGLIDILSAADAALWTGPAPGAAEVVRHHVPEDIVRIAAALGVNTVAARTTLPEDLLPDEPPPGVTHAKSSAAAELARALWSVLDHASALTHDRDVPTIGRVLADLSWTRSPGSRGEMSRAVAP